MTITRRLKIDESTVSTQQPRRSRADSARFAIASTVMEGLHVDAETERLVSMWVKGELSDDELMSHALRA